MGNKYEGWKKNSEKGENGAIEIIHMGKPGFPQGGGGVFCGVGAHQWKLMSYCCSLNRTMLC